MSKLTDKYDKKISVLKKKGGGPVPEYL